MYFFSWNGSPCFHVDKIIGYIKSDMIDLRYINITRTTRDGSCFSEKIRIISDS